MTLPLGIKPACIAGTPERPTISKEPGLALAGAGLGPGAATAAPFKQGPL